MTDPGVKRHAPTVRHRATCKGVIAAPRHRCGERIEGALHFLPCPERSGSSLGGKLVSPCADEVRGAPPGVSAFPLPARRAA